MHEALHQRSISIDIIAGEKQYSLLYQHNNNTFLCDKASYAWNFNNIILIPVKRSPV
jgi:hypothetical protein